MRSRRLFAPLSLTIILASPLPAAAHPHVWVDTILTAVFEQGKVARLDEEWWFDEDFTLQALGEVRTHSALAAAPSPLTRSDVAGLRQKAFSNLANFDYFTHVWLAGAPVGVDKDVPKFAARLEGAKLVYDFTVVLARPVDPKAGPLRIGIWDDSYYVDVGPAKDNPARLAGDGAAGCRAQVVDDKDHPIYFGAVIPKVVQISC